MLRIEKTLPIDPSLSASKHPEHRIPNISSTKNYWNGAAAPSIHSLSVSMPSTLNCVASNARRQTLFSGRLPRFFVVWRRAAGSAMVSFGISENRPIKTHRLFGFAMNHKSGVGFAHNFYRLY